MKFRKILATVTLPTFVWAALGGTWLETVQHASGSLPNRITDKQGGETMNDHSNVMVYFEENRGQFHKNVSYMARGTNGHTLYLTPTDAVYVLEEVSSQNPDGIKNEGKGRKSPIDDLIAERETRAPRRAVAVYMSLVGGNEFAASEGSRQLEHRTNYFKGRQENWRTEVPNYAEVRFDGVYSGVDIFWRGNAAGDAVAGLSVEPFADVSQVKPDEKKRNLLFFIADRGSDGKYRISFGKYNTFEEDNVMDGDIKTLDEGVYHELLLDIFDIDGDGVSEIFTYVQGFEGAAFNVYMRSDGKWGNVFEGSNYHCGF
ncbi:hypothetical protein [Leptolyngbya sp. 7M]|uniref:DUF7948 domain-containing protein n=1 Tax=Leptolyngbya sp. 7M TaxID=2812896 RepID=UPI001B8AB441|nr:hypothetical protein [Leptolyngbya sp. 7M]QYO66100.1 hypothetical protein JVX88_04680 [Leptolyngbya sp. 7M]